MLENKTIGVIVVAAGSGRRMGSDLEKQYIRLGDKPVLSMSIEAFEKNALIDHIYVVVKPGHEEYCRRDILQPYGFQKIKKIIAGGAERSDSVYNGLKAADPTCSIVLIHDGARPLIKDSLITSIIEKTVDKRAVVPGVTPKDTIKKLDDSVVTCTLDRNSLVAVQTPQAFDYALIKSCYDEAMKEKKVSYTDDASIAEAAGISVYITAGDYENIKITTPEDLSYAGQLIQRRKTFEKSLEMRTGIGYDVHAFEPDRPLILGGVNIPFEKGLVGHSDADVLVHAIMDALLGACAMGDIGLHFPDTDPRYRGISSLTLLKETNRKMEEAGWQVNNIDSIIIAQRPKIRPYVKKMVENIGEVLNLSPEAINIKGTTTERLGFTGREEGIAAQASVSINRRNLDR